MNDMQEVPVSRILVKNALCLTRIKCYYQLCSSKGTKSGLVEQD